MSMDGIPEGYEPVAYRIAKIGELFIASDSGDVREAHYESQWRTMIVRKKDPALKIPPGVFADGWICCDQSGAVWWSGYKPYVDFSECIWESNDGGAEIDTDAIPCAKFDDALPWTERIVRVTFAEGTACG